MSKSMCPLPCRLAATSWTLLTAAACLGATPTESERKQAQLLLEQALDHGLAWRQGVVEISFLRRGPQRVTRHEFLAFDHDAGLMRFDCEETDRWDGRDWACKHAVTPTEVLRWTGDKFIPNSVHRYAPGQAPRMSRAEPYDLRVIAVSDAAAVVNQYTADFLRAFYTERYPFRLNRITSVRRDGSRLDATWEIPAPANRKTARNLRQAFLFDMDSAGLPVRIVSELRNADTGKWEPRSTTMIAWQPMKETSVPMRWASVDTWGSTSGYDVDMTFDWKSLNEPLPEELFTLEDFDIDPRSFVLNMKLGAPIIEGPVQEIVNPPTKTVGFEVADGTRVWLIALNVFLLALIVAALLWRRRRAT